MAIKRPVVDNDPVVTNVSNGIPARADWLTGAGVAGDRTGSVVGVNLDVVRPYPRGTPKAAGKVHDPGVLNHRVLQFVRRRPRWTLVLIAIMVR